MIAQIVFVSGALSQSQLMLYQLNAQLPQANQLNPGLFPDYKISIGLPVISSTFVTVNGGNLTFNNAFSRSADDSLHFNPQQLANSLKKNNRLEVNANTQLFYFGLRVKKNFFSIALNERVDVGFSYPKSFVQLLAGGNGAYLGQLLTIDNLGLRAQAYHELGFGYGRDINDKLSVGVRAKFLSGVVGVSTDKIGAQLLTTTDSIYLHIPAFNINGTGLDLIDGNGDIFAAATAFKNPGFAIDIGAHYWVTDKLRVSLAVNDIGSINWQTNTRQLQFSGVTYSFKGIDFIDVINQNNQTDPLTQEADSLTSLFKLDTLDGIGYKSKLSPKFYAAGSYHLGKLHTFGATFYGNVFNGSFEPAFGLSYNLQLGHIWTIGVNASYRNSSFSNFGVGTTLNLGPVQLYLLTENVTAFTKIDDARYIDARFGMNLVFGRVNKKPKKRKEKKEKIKKEEPIQEALPVEPVPTIVLSESVTSAIMGTAEDEMTTGFYIIIASFDSEEESDIYGEKLHEEGYAVLNGYQSELGKYYAYLMYYPEDGNKAIEKKNELKNSLPPGLNTPWVLWVKDSE